MTAGKGTDVLDLVIGEPDFERAVADGRNHSARCMIGLAITAKYGPGARPIVDSDYIRFTNPATGDRLLYRTPPNAAAALIMFDAGIPPKLPLRIRARIAIQRRAGRPASEATIAEVRAWAKDRPEFAGKIADRAPLADDVIAAFVVAHPGRKVRKGHHRVGTSSSRLPKTVLTRPTGGAPPIGNLAGGSLPNVPESRRRTWGSRKLTAVLIEQGWKAPAPTGDGS